jgi:DNA-binding transcriptional regulator YdaS (Cro superfamily)
MASALPDSGSALDRAIEVAGSQSALARVLGVSQNAVSRWARRLTALPPEHVLAVEAATGVSKHELRPDIYPRDVPTGDHSSDPRFEHAR